MPRLNAGHRLQRIGERKSSCFKSVVCRSMRSGEDFPFDGSLLWFRSENAENSIAVETLLKDGGTGSGTRLIPNNEKIGQNCLTQWTEFSDFAISKLHCLQHCSVVYVMR